jgi:hypothetical protein
MRSCDRCGLDQTSSRDIQFARVDHYDPYSKAGPSKTYWAAELCEPCVQSLKVRLQAFLQLFKPSEPEASEVVRATS